MTNIVQKPITFNIITLQNSHLDFGLLNSIWNEQNKHETNPKYITSPLYEII